MAGERPAHAETNEESQVSNALTRRRTDAGGGCTEFTCHFKPRAEGEEGNVDRNIVRWVCAPSPSTGASGSPQAYTLTMFEWSSDAVIRASPWQGQFQRQLGTLVGAVLKRVLPATSLIGSEYAFAGTAPKLWKAFSRLADVKLDARSRRGRFSRGCAARMAYHAEITTRPTDRQHP